jgi:hypothetical protein
MAGISFTTAGDGKTHYLGEKLGTLLNDEDPPTYRVVIRNEAYDNAGASKVSGSGPLAVGTDKQLTCVLVTPQTTAIDSITVHNVRLENIAWNDFTKTCQLSVTWNQEPK